MLDEASINVDYACVSGNRQEYQNQLHHHDVCLARCPLSHERAARVGNECHETLKTKKYTSIGQLSVIYTNICYVYTWNVHCIYIVYTDVR